MADQTGWRFCNKCHGLFFGPNAAQSRCHGGGAHDGSESGPYVMHFGDSATAPFQSGWRFCHKCAGLFFDGNPTTGRTCPAGDRHDASQSGHYMMEFGEDAPGVQGNWRFCKHCFGLFFSRPGSTGHNVEFQGVCSAEGSVIIHDASASGHYHMLFEQSAAPGPTPQPGPTPTPVGLFIQVAGQSTLRQSNNAVVFLNLQQQSNLLSGSAKHNNNSSTSITGSVTNEHVDFTIHWDNGPVGHYTGDLRPTPFATGRDQPLIGRTVDLTQPNNIGADWQSDQLFRKLV
jgi:hypothetical protein